VILLAGTESSKQLVKAFLASYLLSPCVTERYVVCQRPMKSDHRKSGVAADRGSAKFCLNHLHPTFPGVLSAGFDSTLATITGLGSTEQGLRAAKN
jgi:hypothetical protein